MNKLDLTGILSAISKEEKAAFLNKLQSGEFTLNEFYPPQPKLTFNLLPDGRYLCNENSKVLSRDEIASLRGYRFQIEMISNLKQAPSAYELHPFSMMDYLDSLLIRKGTKLLSVQEAKDYLNDIESSC